MWANNNEHQTWAPVRATHQSRGWNGRSGSSLELGTEARRFKLASTSPAPDSPRGPLPVRLAGTRIWDMSDMIDARGAPQGLTIRRIFIIVHKSAVPDTVQAGVTVCYTTRKGCYRAVLQQKETWGDEDHWEVRSPLRNSQRAASERVGY